MATEPVSVLGTLGAGVIGSGARSGILRVDAAGIEIDWWIGADDGWSAAADGAVHTIRPAVAPAIEARRRVPGGEVVLRAYAVTATRALVVAELENASPAPVVVAWVVRAAPRYRIGRVALEGSALIIDERARVELPAAPLRWAIAPRGEGVRDAVIGGNAASGRIEPVVTRRGDLEIAVLFPVAHRTRTRIAASVQAGDAAAPGPVAQLPAPADVERGWDAALESGLRVELPETALQAAVDAARATLMLATVGDGRRDRVVARAAAEWALTPPASRSRARRASGDPWPALRAGQEESGSSTRRAAEWLLSLRDAILRIERDQIDVLPFFPVEWLGLAVAVHDAPTASGPVSFALRWHGVRPALLWDAPEGFRVRAPALDPAWAGAGGAGEALLGEIDPTRLLPLGTPAAAEPGPAPGVAVDDPGSFS